MLGMQVDAKATTAGSGSRAKQDYWGAQVLVSADGQTFDTVMAAINSSTCATCDVTLIVERKKGGENKVSLQLLFSQGLSHAACPACYSC